MFLPAVLFIASAIIGVVFLVKRTRAFWVVIGSAQLSGRSQFSV